MYSDVSEEEYVSGHHRVYRSSPTRPHLQLYEDDVYKAKHYADKNVRKQLEKGVPLEEIEREDFYKLYLTKRFFKSIEGFHEGDLDLTGRHMPRYESLVKRFDAIFTDFVAVSSTIDAVEVEEKKELIDGYSWTHKYVDYTYNDLNKWANFTKKWHVCYAGYGALKEQIKETLEIMKQKPVPKFQQLCLLDLPEEILDLIFSHASIQKARLLSSTCHKLREIGRPYIFTSRTLKLELPSEFWKRTKKVDKEDIPQLMLDTVKTCKSELLGKAAFLMERPDLMDATDTLWLSIHTKEYVEDPDGDLYQPIYQAFANVVHNSRNLRNLTFSQIEFSVEIFQAIVSLPQLLVLDIRSCFIPPPVAIGMFSGAIKPSTSVLNLVLFETGDPAFEIWAPVLLFPNLRTLSVCNFGGEQRFALRPPELLRIPGRSSKVFSTLERLHMASINDDAVVSLTHWVQLNTAETALKLTHLKLTAQIGLEEQYLIQLFEAMRNSPLQVLVLDGIKGGSLVLFDRIAANCPNLLGLTVFRRENMRQRESNLATWPHTTYEYASRFSAFQRLEHFSWNFRIGSKYSELSPACMRYLEDGFISEEELDDMRFRGVNIEENNYFNDGYCVAYPFAAHCPTLKSFSISCSRLSEDFCYIKRKDNGSFELVPVELMRDSNAFEYCRSWDVEFMGLHWLHIFPKSNSHVEEVV